MPVSPIKPIDTKKRQRELELEKARLIPEQIVQVFNHLIAENRFSNNESTVSQDKAIARILKAMPEVTRDQIFDNKWLDIEPLYREEGWKVFYDKPGYNETYTPSWKFSPKDDD
jgi:hypothetical protein